MTAQSVPDARPRAAPQLDMVTFGETMVLMNPLMPGPLRHVPLFVKQFAGAESNVAIAMARLGHRVGWFGKLGRDELGRYVLSSIRAEGVDTSRVILVEGGFTGLFIKERRTARDIRVTYFRKGSAASTLSPADLDESYIAGARILHMTGVTPALSDSCREACYEAARMAKKAGRLVSFDANLRRKLWGEEEFRVAVEMLLPLVDVVFVNEDEGRVLTGADEPAEVLRRLLDKGPKLAVLKRGRQGALGQQKDGEPIEQAPFLVEEVDPIGAGDAFVGGFLSAWLEQANETADLEPGKASKEDIEVALRKGAMCGAYAVTVTGDVEGLPEPEDLRRLMLGQDVAR